MAGDVVAQHAFRARLGKATEQADNLRALLADLRAELDAGSIQTAIYGSQGPGRLAPLEEEEHRAESAKDPGFIHTVVSATSLQHADAGGSQSGNSAEVCVDGESSPARRPTRDMMMFAEGSNLRAASSGRDEYNPFMRTMLSSSGQWGPSLQGSPCKPLDGSMTKDEIAVAPAINSEKLSWKEGGTPQRRESEVLRPHKDFVINWERRFSGKSASSRRTASGATPEPVAVKEDTLPRNAIPALNPDSIAVTLWEVVGLLAMLADCWLVPWLLAFHSGKRDRRIFYASYFPRCYWTVDIFVQFFMGFYTPQHTLQRHLRKTAQRYFKTWFTCDALLVGMDWFTAWLVRPWATTSFTSSPILQCLLAVALLRLLRHAGRYSRVHEKFHVLLWQHGLGENLMFCNKILVIVLFIILFNHVVSCIWYAIGSSKHSESNDTWLMYVPQAEWDNDKYLYFTSLHWSLTQFLPGSMEVFPTNSLERFFNVAVLVGGWVVVVTSTATLTSLMTQRRLQIERQHMRHLKLQKYLHQERVEHATAMGITRHVKARSKEKVTLKASDVEALSLLSTNLQKELAYAVHGAILRSHNFFGMLEALDKEAFISVCSGGIVSKQYRTDDVVFEEGANGESISFLRHGSLSYFPGFNARETQMEVSDDRLTLDHGFFGEPALWCEWVYLGTMACTRDGADVLTIGAGAFIAQLRRHPEVLGLACEFSMTLVRFYQASATRSGWSDLALLVDHTDVVGGMNRTSRFEIGVALLEQLEQRRQVHWAFVPKLLKDSSMQKLQEEIQNGACFVSRHGEEIFRTVFVVALRLRRADGNILAKIGQVSASGAVTKATCQLPGCKRKEQESAPEAVERLMNQELQDVCHTIHFTQDVRDTPELSIMTQESGTYGIRSRYIKSTFEAFVDDSGSFPTKPAGNADLRRESSQTLDMEDWIVTRTTRPGWFSRSRLFKPKAFAHEGNKAPRSCAVKELLAEHLEVTVLPSKDGGLEVFLWVHDAEFQVLQSPNANKYLQLYLKELTTYWELIKEDGEDCQVTSL